MSDRTQPADGGHSELADVIVLGTPKGFAQLRYEIPPALANQVLPGHRVLVPLRSRKLTAMVVRIRDRRRRARPAGLKPLLEILEARPLLDDAHLKLLEFMASYYLSSLPEVYRAVMPGAVRVQSSQEFALAASPSALEEAAFNAAERAVVDALARRPMTAASTHRGCATPGTAAAALRRLVAEGLVKRREAVRGRHRDPTAITVRLTRAAIRRERRKGRRQQRGVDPA